MKPDLTSTMTRVKHLLAATDLSAPARHAVERAAMVSNETGASLDVLHVANLALLERLRQHLLEPSEALHQQVLGTAREKLAALAEALRSKYGVSTRVRVLLGSLLEELAKEAQAVAADLIVCGARGESFMRHLLLGSTAERMLNRTPCAMLVVKQVAHEPYRTLLVPVDFSPSSLRAIGHAQAVAPRAELVLLHVFEVPFEGQLRYASVDEKIIHQYRLLARQEATQKLHALCAQAGLAPYAVQLVVAQGDPSLRIVEQEQEHNCDLIVMGKHGDNALEDLLIGSVTKRVLADSQCDVLVSV